MAWNTPEDQNNNPKKNAGPPNIDKIIADFIKKVRTSFHKSPYIPKNTSPKPQAKHNHKLGLGVATAVIIVAWFLSGLFVVNPAEQAVVLRLGQYNETLGAGLHWIPRFIETKTLVDVQKINSFALEGDFLTKSADQSDLPSAVVTSNDETLSDKSKNLVNVEMTVQYRISDPRAFLYNVVGPDQTIQQVASGALSETIGKMKLDDVLTTGRELLSSAVLERAKEVLNSYHSGLDVVAVTLRKVQAPDQVQAAFNDVNRAEQDKATYIQQAEAYASKVVPLAQGNAARILADANAYQQQTVLNAQAQVARFNALVTVYKSSPDITRERMYLETFENIFANTTKILVDGNGNNILNLPLDKIVPSADDIDDNGSEKLNSGIIAANTDTANNDEIKS